MTTTTLSNPGIFARWRIRLFGERDVVEEQLHAISRQGAHMSRVAHSISFLLVLLFSAGSLAALGADALTRLQAQWGTGHVDTPSAISLIVSTLMVAAMDVALVYAALMLRLLATRHGTWGDRWIHVGVLVLVCVLESATYCYMSFKFETPTTAIAGAIIVARATAAPLLSVYLSLAQPLPITPKDIMAQVELTQGKSLIRDFVIEAADPSVSLADKVALYKASTEGLDALLVATQGRRSIPGVVVDASDFPLVRALEGQHGDESGETTTDAPAVRFGSQREIGAFSQAPSRPPTGGGSPIAARGTNRRRETASTRGQSLQLVAPPEWSDGEEAAQNSADTQGVRTPRRKRTASAKRPRRLSTASVEKKARTYWQPGMSVSQLQIAAGISRSMAGKYRRVLMAEAEAEANMPPEAAAL